MEKFISTVKALHEMQLKGIEKGFVSFDVCVNTEAKYISIRFQASENDDVEYLTLYLEREKDFSKSKKYAFLLYCLDNA